MIKVGSTVTVLTTISSLPFRRNRTGLVVAINGNEAEVRLAHCGWTTIFKLFELAEV